MRTMHVHVQQNLMELCVVWVRESIVTFVSLVILNLLIHFEIVILLLVCSGNLLTSFDLKFRAVIYYIDCVYTG